MYQDAGSDRVNIHMGCSCACVLVCVSCVYVYIYIYIFVWYCLDTVNLTGSWPPLSLETPDTRRNI